MTTANYKSRILIVEDEGIVARDIQAQLKDLGYESVGHATRGEEAVALAGQLRPDLILMDIQLAGAMDGIAAAQAICTQFALPVVFLSAFAADDILARAKLAEPFGYILKPFSERELRTVLEMALYKSRAEFRLRESALHTQSILDNMVSGVVTVDAQGLIQSFNAAASGIFGYALDEVLGHHVAMLLPKAHRDRHSGYLQHFRSTDEARIIGQTHDLEGERKDGSVFPMNLSVSQISRAGRPTIIGIARDISQQHKTAEEIHRLAFYDPLTELPNRRLLMDHVKQAMLTSTRTGQHCALLLLDLDHFKQLNETLGLEVADLLLRQVAARLKSVVSQGDCVARLGGDEFVVLMEALNSRFQQAATQAEACASKILKALGQPYTLSGHTCSCTPSIGIVEFLGAEQSLDELLTKADIAMYQAKDAGRNTLRFFDADIQAAVVAHAQLVADLQRGLAKEEFLLYYQVQVDNNGAPIGAEVLVRWKHAQRGLVSPADFIPLAEETKMILPLGQWVLETACAQLQAWAQKPETARWTMAVNVSALQFGQADFVGHVAAALQKTGANPRLLKLELTESMVVDDVQEVIAKMNAIKAQGVSFSLDDFGTGYSSLSYLKRLPLDQLKIDQSFVRDLLSDPNDAVIAGAIVALGHSLGLAVIAEGVETTAQRDLLAGIGCDAYQGYLFGRPGPASELA
jgi:diguanylate cyclase (GGDEF)-like protein/PAS domain S-box-containing protein